ncbi:MAG: DUF115 domain-containing protein [Spirochaetes bacterium]|nr:DUF115 domain-containing protein [Spirochaetota bacterium]
MKKSSYPFLISTHTNGKEVLQINGKMIHSRYHPEKEGENFKYPGNHLIAVFGIGLGYHLANIIKNNPQSYFIIYEPHEQLYQQLINNTNSLDLLKKKQNQILLLTQVDQYSIFHFIYQNQLFLNSRIYSYSNPGYQSLYPAEENLFLQAVKKSFEQNIQNTITSINFTPLWTKNIIYNLKKTSEIPLVMIKPIIKDKQLAVIAGAGPSLAKDISLLKKYRDKFTLFAVDTALKPLRAHQLEPDFIISLDGQIYSQEDFSFTNTTDTYYLLDLSCYSSLPVSNNKMGFTMSASFINHSILHNIDKNITKNISLIETGGTVADYTLNIAVHLGFTHLYLSGIDLSFPDTLTHCQFSPYHERQLRIQNYFQSPLTQSAQMIMKRQLFQAENKLEGRSILSDFVLDNYATYFSIFANQNSQMQFYYSKHPGLKLKHFQPINFHELVSQTNTKRYHSEDLLAASKLTTICHKDLLFSFETLANKLYETSVRLSKLLEGTNFEQNTPDNIFQYQQFYQNIHDEFPFLIQYSLMTEMILSKKGITQQHSLWYKHIFFKILQSIYYTIRVLQKTFN